MDHSTITQPIQNVENVQDQQVLRGRGPPENCKLPLFQLTNFSTPKMAAVPAAKSPESENNSYYKITTT